MKDYGVFINSTMFLIDLDLYKQKRMAALPDLVGLLFGILLFVRW